MTKTEMIKLVAKMTDVPMKKATAAVDALLKEMANSLKKGDEVKLMNLGKLYAVNVPASVRMNPRTRESVKVPAHKVVRFKVSSVLKKAVW
ncbi:MAG TPA: HU family DNA-binding protein [Candidatus Dojkabacteria bacterium]|nr:HU family DNA-binding protein [Candidatus Dojkabacteria bacterium]HQF36422.1 HU family DNA-binding protein [Candidatus Dojkabacteria bacterium]